MKQKFSISLLPVVLLSLLFGCKSHNPDFLSTYLNQKKKTISADNGAVVKPAFIPLPPGGVIPGLKTGRIPLHLESQVIWMNGVPPLAKHGKGQDSRPVAPILKTGRGGRLNNAVTGLMGPYDWLTS
jgi:hypothetical protein